MIEALRPCRPSLRLRLWLGALGLSLLTIGGAGLAVLGLAATERRAAEALAAQTRVEAWSSLSTRINEWMLRHMLQGSIAPQLADAEAVEAALQRLERLTADDVMAAADEDEASRRAADIRHVAKMKSFFRQLSGLQPQTQTGRAGIAFQLTHAPSIISGRIEHETRRRDAALQGLERLRQPLRLGMAGFVAATAIVLVLLWRGALTPLFAGLRNASAEAGRLTSGVPLAGSARHDELGLMFARMRQASARIARRRRQLERDIEGLEAGVAARTAELREANSHLSAIDAARRRFFADVSHELRTPLTVIMGEAELGAATPDPELRQSFATIGARAERLFRRIEDLMRIAHSESGELELANRDVALESVLAAAEADVAPLLARSGLRLITDLPEDLQVRADPDWLRQVLAGLFENSVKFAGRGTEIRVKAVARGPRVLLTVIDNGASPPPLDAPLFDRHRRAAPVGITGFGLGLSLAHWALQAFGGDLRRLPLTTGFGLELDLERAGDWDDGPNSHHRG